MQLLAVYSDGNGPLGRLILSSRIDRNGLMDTNRTDADVQSYDDDFYGWTQQQAAYLRNGRMDRVDLDNVAEEIESLGKSQLHALTSSYRLIAMHLLEFLVQPEKASASWLTTISRERGNIELMLDDSPGLKSRREERFAKAYDVARRDAAAETHLPLKDFPTVPPFDVNGVESRDFWPPAAQALLESDFEESPNV